MLYICINIKDMKLKTHNCGRKSRITNCLVYGKSLANENLFFNYWVKKSEITNFTDSTTIAIFKLKKLKK